jgi:Sigma-70 region 2
MTQAKRNKAEQRAVHRAPNRWNTWGECDSLRVLPDERLRRGTAQTRVAGLRTLATGPFGLHRTSRCQSRSSGSCSELASWNLNREGTIQGKRSYCDPARPVPRSRSLQDAEDAVQETLLAAWQGLGESEGRASIRTWLYRIATDRCLNLLRSANRRQDKEWDMPEVAPPEPSRLGEVVWLEPACHLLLTLPGRPPCIRHRSSRELGAPIFSPS